MNPKQTKKTPQLEGKKLSYPVGQIARYKKQLRRITDRMIDETNRRVRALLNSGVANEFIEQQELAATFDESITSKAKALIKALNDKFTTMFGDIASPYAKKMVDAQRKISKADVDKSLKEISASVTLKGKLAPRGMKEITDAIIQDNIDLIKSIPVEYLNKINGSLMRSISAGGDTQIMTRALSKQKSITQRRVDLIVDDQVRKTYNAVNKVRMQSSGIKKFKWLHSGGGQHPRPEHVAMSGEIFSFDDLPVIDPKTGETGIPGQAINCRCTMTPVIEFDTD